MSFQVVLTRRIKVRVLVFLVALTCFVGLGYRESCPVDKTLDSSNTVEGRLMLPAEIANGTGDEPDFQIGLLSDQIAEPYIGNLKTVLEKNYLRVLTSKNSFDYFIHNGRHGGYQYEMVKAFTKHLNEKYRNGNGKLAIRFELLPVRNDQMIPMLLAGKGDIIAARLTKTEQRASQVRFTIPYRTVDELLIAHRDFPPLNQFEDLSGARIAVRRSTSYYESLLLANTKLLGESLAPIEIETVDERLETEAVLALVAAGRFSLTVADSVVADTAVVIHPELRVVSSIKLREAGKLAWATHPQGVALQKELNAFLPRFRQGSLLGNMAVKKYFEHAGQWRLRVGTSEGNRLSAYDEIIKKYASQYGFDWRLMAALAYQESGFKQSAMNPSGATGMFQIKPETAREPYINIPDIAGEKNTANNIHAGIKYLAWIKGRYFDNLEEMSEPERIRMSLAAYNAGPRTLLRARTRAREMGLDPNRWFQHVEMALLSMHKTEAVKYVSEINQHYISYVLLGIE